MQHILRTTMAALVLTAVPVLAFAQRGGHGGGASGCEQAVTDVPWGTIDTSCVGGPPGKNQWTGGVGGPGMRISKQAHKDWPNFPARVSGNGYVAGNPYSAKDDAQNPR